MKSMRERVGTFARGSITLFMILLLIPFLTVAGLYVEVQRYNSVISLLDEAMGVSSTSILANMDEYLLDRWGLTAISQDIDIDAEYDALLDENMGVVPNSVRLNKVTAKGKEDSALSNGDVLFSQIQDASRFSAPVTLINSVADLSELIASFESIKSFDKLANGISDTAKTVKGLADYSEHVQELYDTAKSIEEKRDKYDNAFESFRDSIDALIRAKEDYEASLRDATALSSEVQQLSESVEALDLSIRNKEDELKAVRTPEGEDGQNPEEELDIDEERVTQIEKEISTLKEQRTRLEETENDRITEYNNAVDRANAKKSEVSIKEQEAASSRADYSNAIKEYAEKLSEYPDAMSKAASDLKTVINSTASAASNYIQFENSTYDSKRKLDEINDKAKVLENNNATNTQEYLDLTTKRQKLSMEISMDSARSTSIKATESAVTDMVKSWEKTDEQYSEAKIRECVNKLNAQKERVDQYDISSVTGTTPSISQSEYYLAKIDGYVSSDLLNAFLQEQEQELVNGHLKAFFKGISSFFESLFSLSVFFDGDLGACIDTRYYETELGGLPGESAERGSALSIIRDIGDVLNGVKSFTSFELLDLIPGRKLVRLLNALYDILMGIVKFIEDIVLFFTNIIVNLLHVLDYKRWFYTTYSVYNVSCRTDHQSVGVVYKTLTGYEMFDLCLPEKGSDFPININEITSLVDTITSVLKGTGSDLTFCGAELEYILFGSNSEIANQLYVFVVLFLLRIPFAFMSITANPQAQAMTSASTIAKPAVDIILVLAESLVDTILLVNGEKVALYEKTVHLTPEGIAETVTAIVRIAQKDQESVEKMQDHLLEAFHVEDKDNYENWLDSTQQANAEKGCDTSKATSMISDAFDGWTGGLLKLSYREYCLLLMFATVSESEQMTRLGNLIQMEGCYYYNSKGATNVFDLRKTYTFVDAEVEATVNQMLPSLLDSSLFNIDRKQYRGY